uniref:InlB B-repeat-containing protein n=1 Tax=Peptoniphilus grossensis TaxID=1465756 RepID=UPI00288BDD13
KDKHYITPETGKKFIKWDKSPLLNDNTIINENHTFTAYFEWSGLSASGLVRTEAFKDTNNKWTNDFAPTIEDLKKQLVWKEKDVEKPLPAGTEIKLFDEKGNELKTNEDVFNLVKEANKADKDEVVRTVNVKAKVTFKDGKDPQELTIPITVYKNVYEALNKEGDKPLFLKQAEEKEAKDGGLKDILKENTENRYIKVTIKPNKDFDKKDDKVYYVNPNAWVEIPEVKTDGDSNFTNWTADIAAQNEDSKENGKFDFANRHKFTEDTIITPVGAGDVVEQTDPNKKPPVPDSYVKVIVDKTTKAELGTEEKQTQTFWVNPTKEVTIDVTNPTGKTVAADQTVGAVGYTMDFSKWESTETTARVWTDKIVGKFENDTTILAKYSVTPEEIKPIVPATDTVHTPQGKTPTVDEIKDKITPPEGKIISKVTIVENPDVDNPGESKVKVIVEYTDGSSVGTTEKPVEIQVKVHEPVVPAKPDGTRPEEALENYVKVIFKAGTGGSLSGDLVYYVSPEVEVDMTESAGKITKKPDVGYISVDWDTSETKKLKDTFKDDTEFTFNFKKTSDIVEKTDDSTQVIPEGYVKVTFKTEDVNKGKLEGDKEVKIYYVNPKAGIKLKVLGEGKTAGEKELAVPKTAPATNYVFDKWQESIDETNPITSEKVHVAMFQTGQVTLTYEKGGNDVTGDLPENTSVNAGGKVGLAGPGNLKKPNASFAGWKLDEDEKIYQPGDQVILEKARTATAQWTTAKHTVTFNTMGGSNVPKQEVVHGGTLKAVTPPTQKDKVFMGWKEQGKENEEAYFDLTSAINEDKILIAIWQDPVQKINDGDPVEDQFIKVTFLKGAHGTLKEGQTEDIEKVTYKVAKGLSFAEAKGLIVPEIVPNKYYKANAENSGWDKALDLTLATGETEKVFTALYEPEADVIPVEPGKTDTQIEEEKPEGMVLVTFKVSDDNKFYLVGNAKYYVKKDTEVRIPTPVVLEKNIDDVFKGWQDVKIVNEPLDPNTTDPNATKIQLVKQSFSEDTVISDQGVTELKLVIDIPRPGEKIVYIKELSNGATGKLEVISGSESKTYDNTTYKRRGKTSNVFKLDSSVQSGDILKYWAEDGSRRSLPREDSVE